MVISQICPTLSVRSGLEFNDLTRPFHAGRAVPVDAERFAGSRPGQHL
jgi:hypothetical protein